MSVPPNPAVYHLTHLENLATIISAGRMYSVNLGKSQGIKWRNIAHQHLRGRRGARQVPLPPGGTLNDYVPWYFGPRAPMLLPLRDGRVEGYTGGQRPIVHIVSDIQSVTAAGRPWLFTNIHALLAYAKYFNASTDLDKVDWPLMTQRYWNNTTDDPDRESRRQAEFLVHEQVPWTCVQSIGVFDADVASRVKAFVAGQAHVPQVVVKNDWYY